MNGHGPAWCHGGVRRVLRRVKWRAGRSRRKWRVNAAQPWRLPLQARRQDERSNPLPSSAVLSSVNSSLLSYLSALTGDSSTAAGGAAASAKPSQGGSVQVSQAALQKAAGMAKSSAAAAVLERNQKALGTELRAALAKAGVKLSGTVDFSVKSDGSVDVKGSDADKAAMKAFLSSDTSQPTFAARIATQAKDALKLSATIQQTAAISQAARSAKSSAGVMSLYTSFMQQAGTSEAVYSLAASSSSLTYPGSLSANA
jgi:hypothetical protein